MVICLLSVSMGYQTSCNLQALPALWIPHHGNWHCGIKFDTLDDYPESDLLQVFICYGNHLLKPLVVMKGSDI